MPRSRYAMKFSNANAPEDLDLKSLKHTYDGMNFDILDCVSTTNVMYGRYK